MSKWINLLNIYPNVCFLLHDIRYQLGINSIFSKSLSIGYLLHVLVFGVETFQWEIKQTHFFSTLSPLSLLTSSPTRWSPCRTYRSAGILWPPPCSPWTHQICPAAGEAKNKKRRTIYQLSTRRKILIKKTTTYQLINQTAYEL